MSLNEARKSTVGVGRLIAKAFLRTRLPIASALASLAVEGEALAQVNADLFYPPSGQLALKSLNATGGLYGASSATARWHVAQWDNPGGNNPDFLQGRSDGSNLRVVVSGPRSDHYTIFQLGAKSLCAGGNLTEFDGFIGSNATSDKGGLSPAINAADSRTLADYKTLRLAVQLHVDKEALLPEVAQICRQSKAVSIATVVLSNAVSHQTLFYQLVLHSFQIKGAGFSIWWANGAQNGRFGFNEDVRTLGEPLAAPGITQYYNIELEERLKNLLQNEPGIDTNPRHWRVTGSYFGNSTFGGVAISTTWSQFALTAS